MPQNCSADWKKVMAHIDNVLMHGSTSDKGQLKQNMGVGNRSDEDTAEFASRWLDGWQGQQYATGYSGFFQMCDFIEVCHGLEAFHVLPTSLLSPLRLYYIIHLVESIA